jgi:DUF4097 and DUF4098 domain-containing protein YvlB
MAGRSPRELAMPAISSARLIMVAMSIVNGDVAVMLAMKCDERTSED